ncbi:MAG: phage major capsid protein [Patescibacteria group bacterium]|nr:phage major capsid protein [Patescibacteria group bacterium]
MAAYPTSPVSTLTGSGITPSGALGAQLAALTRRAFLPSVFVQIYQSHPLLSLFLSNAKAARGGVSQITVPVQGSSFVNFNWGSFAGDFPMPTDQTAIQNAQFSLKLGMVPIGFFGMEAIIQSSEVVIPKLRAVMSDAAVVIKQAFAQALYSNNYANPQVWDSLAQAYDDGSNVPSYGGIARTPGSFWSGQLINNTGAAATTRVGMAQILTRVQAGAGGEAVDYAVLNPANWAELMSDFMSLEMFTTRPKSIYDKDDVVNAGFRAIRVLDTPIFPDPFCPLGSCFLINSRYTGLYMSEYAPMTFSGFESQIAVGQISDIGVLISAADLVCAKPSSGGQITNITGAAWPNVPGTLPAVL